MRNILREENNVFALVFFTVETYPYCVRVHDTIICILSPRVSRKKLSYAYAFAKKECNILLILVYVLYYRHVVKFSDLCRWRPPSRSERARLAVDNRENAFGARFLASSTYCGARFPPPAIKSPPNVVVRWI